MFIAENRNTTWPSFSDLHKWKTHKKRPRSSRMFYGAKRLLSCQYRPSVLRAPRREEMGRKAAVNVEITGQRMSEPRSFFFPLSFSVSRSVCTQEMRKAAASPPPALCWTSPPPSLKAWSCTSTPRELYSKQAAWKAVIMGNNQVLCQTTNIKRLKSSFFSRSFGGYINLNLSTKQILSNFKTNRMSNGNKWEL